MCQSAQKAHLSRWGVGVGGVGPAVRLPLLSEQVTKSIWKLFLKDQLKQEPKEDGVSERRRGAGGLANREQIAECECGYGSCAQQEAPQPVLRACRKKFGSSSHPCSSRLDSLWATREVTATTLLPSKRGPGGAGRERRPTLLLFLDRAERWTQTICRF